MINKVIEIASIEEYEKELNKFNMKRNILGLGQFKSLEEHLENMNIPYISGDIIFRENKEAKYEVVTDRYGRPHYRKLVPAIYERFNHRVYGAFDKLADLLDKRDAVIKTVYVIETNWNEEIA